MEMEAFMWNLNQILHKELLQNLLPYLKLKQRQAKLMIEIIERKKQVKSPKEFIELAKIIDLFRKINYSKKRTQNSIKVKKVLEKEGLLAP